MCCKTDPKKVIVHVVSLSLIGMPPKGSYVSTEESNTRLIAKVIFGVLFQFPFLFLPAGTLNWPAAWLYLLFFAFYALAVTLYLKRKNPELLRSGHRTGCLKKVGTSYSSLYRPLSA